MLLRLETAARGRDFSWLLAKNPTNTHRFDLSVGTVHVLFERCDEAGCAVVVYLDIEPVGLVRGRRRGDQLTLGHYVNDRPYAAGTLLGIALNRAFRTPLAGKCAKPELLDVRFPMRVELPAVRAKGGIGFLRRCFEPLGYAVEAEALPLDAAFPGWGDSGYASVRLSVECTVPELLSHLVVLLPVLAADKHHWVDHSEVDKLLDRAEAWLADHPEKEEITRRYLKRRGALVRAALERLLDTTELDEAEEEALASEEALERALTLNQIRLATLHDTLKALGCQSVLDLGCGEGRLVYRLGRDPHFSRVVGIDVSSRALEVAERRVERLPERLKGRVELRQGSVVYRDERFAGFDAAVLVEVIEHVDAERLPTLARVVFEFARPQRVLISTPNAEYNARFAGMEPGAMRHRDHRFEWTRAELRAWCERVCAEHGYTVAYAPIGEEDPELGPPTQLAIFTRGGEA